MNNNQQNKNEKRTHNESSGLSNFMDKALNEFVKAAFPTTKEVNEQKFKELFESLNQILNPGNEKEEKEENYDKNNNKSNKSNRSNQENKSNQENDKEKYDHQPPPFPKFAFSCGFKNIDRDSFPQSHTSQPPPPPKPKSFSHQAPPFVPKKFTGHTQDTNKTLHQTPKTPQTSQTSQMSYPCFYSYTYLPNYAGIHPMEDPSIYINRQNQMIIQHLVDQNRRLQSMVRQNML